MRNGQGNLENGKRPGYLFFEPRIDKRKQQADGDGINFRFPEPPHQRRQFCFIDRFDDFAGRRHASTQAETKIIGHERRRSHRVQVVEFRPRLPPDDEHIFKAARGDQRRARAAPLEQRIGADGCAVDHFDAPRRHACLF